MLLTVFDWSDRFGGRIIYFCLAVSAEHIWSVIYWDRRPGLENKLNPIEVERALNGLTAAEWKIIKSMARLYAAGLILFDAEDLISETYTALFSGDRVFPRDAKPVNVVINAMHSEASNCREREKNGPIDTHVDVASLIQPIEADDDGGLTVVPSTEITPDSIVQTRSLLTSILAIGDCDPELEELLTAYSLELRGQEAADFLDWDINRFEAARKRLARRLAKLEEE